MNLQIEPFDRRHLDAVVRLSLRAWAPVFESIQGALEPDVYRIFYPDWRVAQQKAVKDACNSADMKVWVAVVDGQTRGFVAVRRHDAILGEVYMIAVDPDAQRRGIARNLTTFALNWMKENGMAIAMVETGGDPGHAPARSTYEHLGFRLFPAARYFKKL